MSCKCIVNHTIHFVNRARAGDNPVYFVDVNGEWIYINDGSNGSYRYTDGKTQKKNEETGKYEDIDGNTYLSDFVFETIVNLESLKESGDTGKGLIDHFDKEGNDISIEFLSNKFDRTGNKLLLDWGYADNIPTMTTEGIQMSKNFIELGHEMGHVKDPYKYMGISWMYFKSKNKSVHENEIYATHIENMIRAESGHPLRTQYVNGVKSSTIIDNDGNSVFFNNNGVRNVFQNKTDLQKAYDISKSAFGGVILQNRYNYYQKHSGGCYCGN